MTIQVSVPWFAVSSVGDGVTRVVEPHADPLIRCNMWHVRGRDHDLLVDSGLGLAPLRDALAQFTERQPWAVATHTHFDHSGGMHEFAIRLAHPAEAASLVDPDFASIRVDDYPPRYRALIADVSPGGELVTAHPFSGFDAATFRTRPAPATRLVDEGDVIDVGDRRFTVLHLPGHSPGSIGLWEAEGGTLFAGDAIYDGELLEDLPGSDVPAYISTMERLSALAVTVVHAGHGESFGQERMIEICNEFLRGHGA